jgi:PAS domain S-box-containing protein
MIASSICISGDPIHLCLSCNASVDDSILSVLYTPYELGTEEETFLKEHCVDLLIKSPEEAEVAPMLNALANGQVKPRTNGGKLDQDKLAAISRSLHDAAVRDLASRAKKLEEILENSSDVIYELDPYGRIILISKAIEKYTGYTREELMGMSALDMVSSDSIEVVANHISLLLSGGAEPPAVEVGVQGRDGHVIPAEMIVRPIRHKNQVAGILGIGRNVEERKRLEESLKRALNEKDFYLDLMSHDIQNFNQAIIGYIEMIMSTEGLSPKMERYAQGAFRQVTQTAQLIAHLKRIADIRQHGKDTMQKRDLRDLIEKNINNLQSRLDKKLVAISLDCPDGQYPIMAGEDINDLLELLVAAAMRYAISEVLHIKISISSEAREGMKYWSVTLSGNNLKLSAPVVKCMISQDYSGCQMIERPDLQLLVARAIVETQDGTIETRFHENGRGDGFVIRIPQA